MGPAAFQSFTTMKKIVLLFAGGLLISAALAGESRLSPQEKKLDDKKTAAQFQGAQKPQEVKKEEKPSPPPSGPQADGAFRKVILDSDQKRHEQYADTLQNPMELTVAKDGRVFFAERGGVVKVWKPESHQSVEIGKLEVFTELEDGLLGITLDPGFAENHWLYLMYSLPTSGSDALGKKCGTNRVSRFTLAGEKLDLASEKKLIDIPTQREQCCHAGGSLAFDAQGNLYISTGDNTNPFESDGFAPVDERKGRSPWDAQKSSANANDLRGKILRLRPQPDGSYVIPPGNLFSPKTSPKISRTIPAMRRGAELLVPRSGAVPKRATDVRPEIYVMGCRNPFRISLDQKNNYLYWGDVGPDATEFKENKGPAGMDEINQARQAGFFGWPYFTGENKAYWKRNFKARTNVLAQVRYDPQSPVNASPNNTGWRHLPAAQPAMIYYPNGPSIKFPVVNGEGGRTAMAGPVYYFDPHLKSDRKLPKEWNHTLFIYDWSRNWIIAVHLDPDNKIEKMERFCPKMTFKRPMDMELGPDGCLYIIEWGTAWGGNKDTQLVRVEYAPTPPDKGGAEILAK